MTELQRNPPSEPGLSLVALTNILLRRRRFIAMLAVGMAVVAFAYYMFQPREYTVAASFIIRTSNPAGGAAGLAAQLGVDVGGTDVSQSPEFYARLVRTPDVLTRLIDTTFATSDDAKRRSLAEIWQVSEANPALRHDILLRRLTRSVSSNVGSTLDVVTVTATTHDPLLSKELTEALIAQINRFNLQTLQLRASAERRFTESRMQQVQGELRVAEGTLQRFLEDNRQQYLSPALEIEKARLGRKVDLLQQTFTTLATAFERARIDEVRDTPLITQIQKPVVPVRADARGTVRKAILAFAMGLFFGSLLVLAREAVRWLRSSKEPDALEFNRLVTDASRDMLRLRSVLTPGGREKGKHIAS